MSPRDVAPLFKLRARANAAVGNFRESYDDLDESLRRTMAADEARRIRQAATLSARFETDRQLERNAELNRELVDRAGAATGSEALDHHRHRHGRDRHHRC